MVELLTVLVIIGVLTSISLVAYGRARDRSRLSRIKSNVGEIALALDDFARDHNSRYPALTDYHVNLPPSITTDPVPPVPPPNSDTPLVLKRKGNAIIGGSSKLADTGNPLQDDFFKDLIAPQSNFRLRRGEPVFGTGPMHPVDQLILNGQFEAYPINPLAGPGVPMVNVAHILYDYDTQTNDFQWVQFTLTDTGERRVGLCAAIPDIGGFYKPIPVIWNEQTYPQGDFAYIPFEFTNEQGTYCNGYWIISYGDLTTLKNSPYNRFALDQNGFPVDPSPKYANWPNLPPPYGDGDPTTSPDPLSFEYQVKHLMLGALDVRATVFEDQLAVITEDKPS
jgi:type II secretory pathway pseudopilin PulG